MTNMKALPMLDHVMLWIARGFSLFLLAWTLGEFGMPGFSERGMYIGYFFPLVLGLFVFLSIWLVKIEVCRLTLALASVAAMIIISGILFSDYSWPSNFANLMTDIGAPGFLATFWTAVRPSFRTQGPTISTSNNSVNL